MDHKLSTGERSGIVVTLNLHAQRISDWLASNFSGYWDPCVTTKFTLRSASELLARTALYLVNQIVIKYTTYLTITTPKLMFTSKIRTDYLWSVGLHALSTLSSCVLHRQKLILDPVYNSSSVLYKCRSPLSTAVTAVFPPINWGLLCSTLELHLPVPCWCLFSSPPAWCYQLYYF